MKKIWILFLVGMINASAFSQTKWNVDVSHTTVKFTVTHLVITEVDGLFKVFDGSIQTKNADFVDAQIDFSVDASSINTNNEMRDNHLKGDDFFNTEKFPKMTFKSKSFKKISGNKYELIGDLTIRDITKNVKFDVSYGGIAKDPWGNIKAGFKASTQIKRSEYNLKWNTLTESGGAVVSDEVDAQLKLEFNQAK